MAETGGAAAATAYERVAYEGRPGLVGLLSKNFFLTLITIGIYRFWAATRLRRYLWSNIRIGGDGLEYTGTGRELFLGFLVALAVLAPLSIDYIVVDRLALGNPVLATGIQGVYFVSLFVFLQVALFRARRYRLSRTEWRGIYAGQTGSTWHYLGLFIGYGLLTVVTLGVALPWMHVALARYKLDNTCFGDHRMSIDARGIDLLWPWLVVLAAVCVPLALALAILPNLSPLLHPVYVDIPLTQENGNASSHFLHLPHPVLMGLMVALALGLGFLALVWYRIEAFRYLGSRVRLGPMLLHSGAKGLTGVGRLLLGCLGMFAGFLVLSICVAIIVAGISMLIKNSGVEPETAVFYIFAAALPFYLVLLWLMQLVTYCWLWIPIIKHLATTLAIENFGAAQEIAQSTQPRQKLGIADSFELGAF